MLRLVLAALLVLVFIAVGLWTNRFGEPDDFDDMATQFKYGSIGADNVLAQASLPYWIWRVLPELKPPLEVPPTYNQRPSFENFGFVVEPSTEQTHSHIGDLPALDRPIGFSRRRVFGMDFVGMNCSICHLTAYRANEGGPRRTALGGPGNTVDIERYFRFLFEVLTDSTHFNAQNVMPLIDAELERQKVKLPWHQRLLYKHVLIPWLPGHVKRLQAARFDFIEHEATSPGHLPDFGPGRVDTWGLYKRLFVEPPQRDKRSGISDFPSMWNQQARAGMRMHWDGNNAELVERNIVSGLSLIGKRIDYLDFDRLSRVTEWIKGLLPPRYVDQSPEPVDVALAQQGSLIFLHYCSGCHSMQSDRIGRVEPIEGLGTDRSRLEEFTPELRDGLNRLGTAKWKVRRFTLENGYVNKPLDGVWLLGPYLHNGSVPTIRALLTPPAARPTRFCRGGEVYDWKDLGFQGAAIDVNGCEAGSNQFLYDTHVVGNSNQGHAYGTSLTNEEKNALIEFLKTL